MRRFSVRFCQLLKEKASLQQESRYLQEWLVAIDDKMTEIEDLEDKVISIKDAVDNNNQETIESSTNDFISYYFIFIDEVSTLTNHPVEFDKLLTFFESIV